MARPLRVEYPGAFYHVISKGNAGEKVFKTKKDKEKFLEYLEKDVELFSVIIHSFCIMTDHYHLLIETPLANLSTAVQWLNGSYATYYSKRHKRDGQVFHGRFKSILTEKDDYIKELSRYVHLNPVRAKIAKSPLEYRWSSYASFVEKTSEYEWLETDGLLTYFDKRRKSSVLKYKKFVEDVDAGSLKNQGKGLIAGFILGGDEFVKDIYKEHLSKRSDKKEISQEKELKPNGSVDKIVKVVCFEFGCRKKDVRQKGLKRNRARDIAIYLSRDISGVSCSALGVYFGGISGSAITARYKSVFNQVTENSEIRNIVDKIKANM